ncbi:MAG TPA: FAD binding domain-containing protein [Synergistaceae bacterium]|nr:FAD binding domain-containing protein [Synergistaceae bacterium]HQF90979.1 FAD binding domain-containing protein [Synergistaceae bacterium]HQH77951.1 FAD binding domain-containing protein [Synergistaceae bacterium]HQK24301.1 FAD binding domain-containing protein [Synergistaceae bacterium]
MSLTWYVPREVQEVPELLAREGVYPHGGGTLILRGKGAKIRGLVDLSLLGLDGVRFEQGTVALGAMVTFAGCVARLGRHDPDHILVKALSRAASTPLRNRITLGGSVAAAPIWSDLLGPLVALDAEVILRGPEGSTVTPVASFVREGASWRGALVTGLRFREEGWRAFYHREVTVAFDSPAFTLSILARVSPGRVEELRVVLTGSRERFIRLVTMEELIQGKDPCGVKVEGLGERFEAAFPDRRHGSGAWLRTVAGVALERGLREVLGPC